MPDSSIELFVNGKIYTGWESASINRSIKSISGSFKLDITDNWSGSSTVFTVKAGDEAEVKINGETVITGYVEQIENEISSSSHTISISGRDKTGDLCDCSAIYGQGEILNADLLKIAQVLIEPFGLSVKSNVSVGDIFSNFCLQGGESVFDALERAARLRGLMFSTDGFGNLIITEVASKQSVTALIEGQNIKKADLSLDTRDRFSKYICKGQITGTDENYGDQASQSEGSIEDETINRYRPLVIIAENQASTADALKRVQWEAVVRASNSAKATVTVQGFEQKKDGPLWAINELILFDSPTLGIKETMLITDVAMTLSSSSGKETALTLAGKDAYLPEPVVMKQGDMLKKYNKNVTGYSNGTTDF